MSESTRFSGPFYPYWGGADPQAYELLNQATDPEGRIDALMESLAPMDGRTVLDVGAGSGFHAVRFARRAAHVYAAEPDPRMLRQIYGRLSHRDAGRRLIWMANLAGDRLAGLRELGQRISQVPGANISVLAAGAESIPLRRGHIDIAHARFAYFFGTEACSPGIAEVKRLLAPRGHFFIIDTNPDHGQFGALARQAYPTIFFPDYVESHAAFYAAHGFSHHMVETCIRAEDREGLERILRADFPKAWRDLLDQVAGAEISFAVSVFHFQRASL